MSFSKHEHRFALQAAEADRASAMEELHRAKVDLKHRTLDTEKLQAEISGHREQVHTLSAELDGLRGRMAELSTEKNDALDQQIHQLQLELDNTKADRENMRESSISFFTRHGELQREHDTVAERYSDLTAHFQALQGQYSDTQRRLAEVEKARSVALAERDECLEKMDSMRPVASSALSMSTSTNGQVETAIEGRIRRELRRSSLAAFQDHAALEQLKKLELLEGRLKEERENVAAEKERVKRREGEFLSSIDWKGS
jgi:chromosome segregation ATPase